MSTAPQTLQIPPVESPFFEQMLAAADLPQEHKRAIRDYADKGYLIVDLDLPDFAEVAAQVVKDLAPHYPPKDRRIEEAWYFSEGVRKLAILPQIVDILRILYQREPIPFQTLNFDAGTQQPAHSDTVHFHCVPRHYMAGVWVALEDIDGDCGPLFVLPGSHKLPDFDMFDLGLPSSNSAYHGYEATIARILASEKFERVELHLKKGQAAIWAANLFHGGSPMKDPKRTRHSQATHYYFENCLYYMPLESDFGIGRLTYREVLDIRTGRVVPHLYRGQPVALPEPTWTYARPVPSWVKGLLEDPKSPARLDESALRKRVRALERQVDELRSGAARQLDRA